MEVSKRESILLLKKEMCPNRRGIQKQCKSLLHLRQCKPYDNREKKTATEVKTRMQKSFLVDTLKKLHKKYLADNPKKSVSYSLFCRLRPYWVVHPMHYLGKRACVNYMRTWTL